MDDLEFVQRCVNGDKQSWDEFIDRYSRLVYNYIHATLALKGRDKFDRDNVNDLFQEIFLSLVKDNFKKLRSFKGKNGCSLASWLRQIAINYTIDYLRRLKPSLSLEQENEQELRLKDVIADDKISVKDMLTDEEKLERLKECIDRLNTEEQYFLEMYLNQNLALEEIKDMLGISRGALDMRKSRIIEKLKECFKDKGFMLDS
ncbi:MAG: RNA polymerase sigma factor [Candidatus Omnitrophica bacterium]|nr:RNA polymerase sigma factor [Candidatus Omnitrophota bacterium]